MQIFLSLIVEFRTSCIYMGKVNLKLDACHLLSLPFLQSFFFLLKIPSLIKDNLE